MRAADEFQRVREDVFFWQSYEPSVKVDCSSCALRTGSGLVFVDPIPLASEALDELLATAPASAVILTNGNHERAAGALCKRLGVPLLAHEEAAHELTITPNRTMRDGDIVFDEIEIIELPGAGTGEIALRLGDAVVTGDALINLDPAGLTVLPDKYCADAKRLRVSLQKLLRFPIELLTFAHGLPISARAGQRLKQLLT